MTHGADLLALGQERAAMLDAAFSGFVDVDALLTSMEVQLDTLAPRVALGRDAATTLAPRWQTLKHLGTVVRPGGDVEVQFGEGYSEYKAQRLRAAKRPSWFSRQRNAIPPAQPVPMGPYRVEGHLSGAWTAIGDRTSFATEEAAQRYADLLRLTQGHVTFRVVGPKGVA